MTNPKTQEEIDAKLIEIIEAYGRDCIRFGNEMGAEAFRFEGQEIAPVKTPEQILMQLKAVKRFDGV